MMRRVRGETKSVGAGRSHFGEAASDHAVTDLLAVAAHELRSPLASVRGFSATLLRQWDRFDDDQKRLMVAAIESDADRLARLVQDLLDASRLGTPRLVISPAEFDLRELVDAHLHRLTGSGIQADRFDWAESAESGAGLRLVFADRGRVEQILANLVENALSHGAGTIALATDVVEEGMVGLTVSDQGPGIDPAHEEHVFTKFWRGPHQGGTGLGLYLVKGLVEAHGGAVIIGGGREGPRSGACFRVTIPAPSR